MKKFIALFAIAAVTLGVVSTAEAGHCAAPVVQQVYAPAAVVAQPVVVANVVTVQPAAIVVPSAPLAVVQVAQHAAVIQQVVQKVQVQRVVQQKQVVRSRTVIR